MLVPSSPTIATFIYRNFEKKTTFNGMGRLTGVGGGGGLLSVGLPRHKQRERAAGP